MCSSISSLLLMDALVFSNPNINGEVSAVLIHSTIRVSCQHRLLPRFGLGFLLQCSIKKLVHKDHISRGLKTPLCMLSDGCCSKCDQELLQQAVVQAVCRYFDEGIGFRGMRKLDRRRRSNFEFVREGQFQKEAEIARIRVSAAFNTSACCLTTSGLPLNCFC